MGKGRGERGGGRGQRKEKKDQTQTKWIFHKPLGCTVFKVTASFTKVKNETDDKTEPKSNGNIIIWFTY